MKPALVVAALAAVGIIATLFIDTTFSLDVSVEARENGVWTNVATDSSRGAPQPYTPVEVKANGSVAMRVVIANDRLFALGGPVVAHLQVYGAGASTREIGRLADGVPRGETRMIEFSVNASEIQTSCSGVAVMQKVPGPPCRSASASVWVDTPGKTTYFNLDFEVVT